MRVAALLKPFYRTAAYGAAALSDCTNARLRDLRRGGPCVRAGTPPPKPPASCRCLAVVPIEVVDK